MTNNPARKPPASDQNRTGILAGGNRRENHTHRESPHVHSVSAGVVAVAPTPKRPRNDGSAEEAAASPSPLSGSAAGAEAPHRADRPDGASLVGDGPLACACCSLNQSPKPALDLLYMVMPRRKQQRR